MAFQVGSLIAMLRPLVQPNYSQILKLQKLAIESAKEVFNQLEIGMTEKDTTNQLYKTLQSKGIDEYFHYPFAWFGNRTAFKNFSRPLPLLQKKTWKDITFPKFGNSLPHLGIEFLPTDTKLKRNDPVILDIAPVINGNFVDIGYSNFFGKAPKDYRVAHDFLMSLRDKIPEIVKEDRCIEAIYNKVDALIQSFGMKNCHDYYPLGVLGHKVGKIHSLPLVNRLNVLGFSPNAFSYLLLKNITAPFVYNKNTPYLADGINQTISNGLWSIEPHIGNAEFGLKFEEILVIEDDAIYWLSEVNEWESFKETIKSV